MLRTPRQYLLADLVGVSSPTQAQYILIHQALLEHTQFGETENALQELHSTLNTLKQRSSDNEPTLLEDEFEVWNLFLTTRLNEEAREKGPACEMFKWTVRKFILYFCITHVCEKGP